MSRFPASSAPASLSFAAASRVAPLIGFIVVGLCTFAWLTHINGPFPIHGDGIRDQLLVRDCTELGRCHLLGAPTSMRGAHIFQGAVWLDLLTAVRLLGGDTATQVDVVLALNALAAALTFIVVWRWLHPALALPAGYLVADALAGDQAASLLVNGSGSALFDVVTAAGALCYGMSNRTRFLLISAFAAALAVNVHIGAASLLPGMLLVAALGPRPYRAVSTAAALFAAVYLATSATAFWANGIALADFAVVLLPSVVLFVVVATKYGPRFRRRSMTTRAVLIAAFLVLPFIVAALWLVFIDQHVFEARYFHPIFGPVAVLEAAILCAPLLWLAQRSRWLPWMPSVLSFCLLTQHVSGAAAPLLDSVRTWTLTDATTIGLEAARRGLTFEDLAFHVQSKACGELLLGIAVEGPRREEEPPADDVQLQVATVESDPSPLTDEQVLVRLQTGELGIVRTVRSWLRPRGIQVCRRRLDDAAPPSCRPLALPQGIRSAQDEVRRMAVGGDESPGELSFESRAALTHEYVDVPPPYVTSYRIPVQPVRGEARELRLADPGVGGCRWEFTHADGLRIPGHLPATSIRVEGESDGPGELVVEKVFGAPACPPHEMEFPYPPCVLETRPGERFQTFVAASR